MSRSEASFAALAVELKLVAKREAHGVEALELLAAKQPQQVFEATLKHARESAALVAQAHYLLKALIPHECAVRALLEADDERSDAA